MAGPGSAAAELGQPQTKLYRHVRQLEAAGLIKVAATRLVSGILEQRYQACQRDLTFGRGFLREHVGQADVAMQVILDRYRDGFLAAVQADRPPAEDVPAEEPYRKPLMFMSDLRIPAAKAAELRSRLEELIEGLKDDQVEDPEGVPMHLLFGYYVADDPDVPRTTPRSRASMSHSMRGSAAGSYSCTGATIRDGREDG